MLISFVTAHRTTRIVIPSSDRLRPLSDCRVNPVWAPVNTAFVTSSSPAGSQLWSEISVGEIIDIQDLPR